MNIYQSTRFKVERLHYPEPIGATYRVIDGDQSFNTTNCPGLNDEALNEMWDEYMQLFFDGCYIDATDEP